jgi:hypothetical protein
MKPIKQFLFALVALFGLMPSLAFGQPNNPNDPNTDPNWDWRNGDDPNTLYPASVYRMYVEQSLGVIVPVFRNAPWGQSNVWDGILDNRKEDGWVLVQRDFGTPTRPVFTVIPGQSGTAYFALYNRYRGLLRVFFIIRGPQQNFTTGALTLQFGGNERTATLTHLKPHAFATDKKDSVKNHTASGLIKDVLVDQWAWADFPMAYDPTIAPSTSYNSPRMLFRLIGTTESNVVLKGVSTGINGQPEEVRQFMTASGNGAVTITQGLSQTTAPGQNTFNLTNFLTQVSGTSEKWEKFVEVAEKIGKKIKTDPNNPLRDLIYPTASFLASGALSATGLFGIAGAISGIFDYFVGGGQPDPRPTYFGMNLELSGTITTTYVAQVPMSIVVPGSKSDALQQPNAGSFVPLVFNKPVGLFNLTATPVIKYKSYYQFRFEHSFSKIYHDFQIQNFQYAINSESGLELDSIRVWMTADPTEYLDQQDNWILLYWANGHYLNLSPPHQQIQLESAIDYKYVFSTIPVAENAIVGQTIQMPGKLGTASGNPPVPIAIKVKAVFHRKDNPSEKPVVFIATYKPDLVYEGFGRYPALPPPPPPPAFRTISVARQYLESGSSNMQTISQYSPSTTVTVPASENIGGQKRGQSDGGDRRSQLKLLVSSV